MKTFWWNFSKSLGGGGSCPWPLFPTTLLYFECLDGSKFQCTANCVLIWNDYLISLDYLINIGVRLLIFWHISTLYTLIPYQMFPTIFHIWLPRLYSNFRVLNYSNHYGNLLYNFKKWWNFTKKYWLMSFNNIF